MPEPPELPDPLERADVRARARADIERRRRREPEGRFWRAAGLMGSVGWPIVLLSVGGAVLGRYLDGRAGTGVRFTLILLVVGASLGTFMALRAVRGAS